jgi:hypothetical protein
MSMNTFLSHPPQEIAAQAMLLYSETLQKTLEIPENIGFFLSIDIESGSYELSQRHWDGSRKLKESHPDAIIYTLRIGYPAAVSLSGRVRPLSETTI